jgi:hypothetical protein
LPSDELDTSRRSSQYWRESDRHGNGVSNWQHAISDEQQGDGKDGMLTLKQICTLAMWCRFQEGENMALANRSTVRFCVSSFPR